MLFYYSDGKGAKKCLVALSLLNRRWRCSSPSNDKEMGQMEKIIVMDGTHRKGPGGFQIHLHRWVDSRALPKSVIGNKTADRVGMVV